MPSELNQTHDAALRSWVASANAEDTDFPIQNLPFGVFSRKGQTDRRIGVAIGDQIIDVSECDKANVWGEAGREVARACTEPTLNRLAQSDPESLSNFRARLSEVLSGEPDSSGIKPLPDRSLIPMADVEMHMPFDIGDYTDFYASIYHATNVGKLFRPDNPLLPNYKYVPIGYHGRASSIVLSGTTVTRPRGQTVAPSSSVPSFGRSELLDYEAEVGFFVGKGNDLGDPVPIEKAEDHIFGVCLVNDWSARDIQAWEYQPLGPFLSKSFATTISPWIVTLEALAPFRCGAFERSEPDPRPLPYLLDEADQREGGLAIDVEMHLRTAAMAAPARVSRASFRDSYWTPAQLVAHHTSNGCNLHAGDLLGSGTLSGASPDSLGSLMELTQGGKNPLALPGGESRRFLEDGDEAILRG